MCGKAYDPRFIFAYPSAQIAVMGSKQASETMLSIKVGQLERDGKTLSDQEKQALLNDIAEKYTSKMTPLYAAARLWIDDIIDPRETRRIISYCIEVANENPEIPKFNAGVLQT
ncbi:MAG: hypothetical protein HY22_14520 [[Candidatus Thermochlorobacteriaceae] bacterium GBChlB]|nr:MAG: hypothetical protein HY22_14520 [[Candidatus Thermochlorobacteriaceae] bacterium GBChlB]